MSDIDRFKPVPGFAMPPRDVLQQIAAHEQFPLPDLVREDDWLFFESPDVGDPSCVCSRCSKPITKGIPVRVFVNEGADGEYRYHGACVGLPSLDSVDAAEFIPGEERDFGDEP